MATEEQKKGRQLRLFNDIIAAFAKGLYELFDDSALAMADTIGTELLVEMEQELGLEIAGENPQEILTEVERLLVDEYGMSKDAKMVITDDRIDMQIEGCLMWKATEELLKNDIPPFTCVPMMMASASLHKRLGKKTKFEGITQDTDKHICDIVFRTN